MWPQPSPASGHSAKVASVPSHSGPDMAMGIRLNMLSPRSRCTKLPVAEMHGVRCSGTSDGCSARCKNCCDEIKSVRGSSTVQCTVRILDHTIWFRKKNAVGAAVETPLLKPSWRQATAADASVKFKENSLPSAVSLESALQTVPQPPPLYISRRPYCAEPSPAVSPSARRKSPSSAHT